MTTLEKAGLAAYIALGVVAAGIYVWSEIDKAPMMRDAFFVVAIITCCMVVGWPVVFAGFLLALIDEWWWRA